MPAREELEQLFRRPYPKRGSGRPELRPHQYRRARIRHRLEGRLVREIVPEISKDRSRADFRDEGIVQPAPMKRESGGLAFTASAQRLDLCYPLVRGHQYFKRGRGDASDIVFTVRLQPLPAVR